MKTALNRLRLVGSVAIMSAVMGITASPALANSVTSSPMTTASAAQLSYKNKTLNIKVVGENLMSKKQKAKVRAWIKANADKKKWPIPVYVNPISGRGTRQISFQIAQMLEAAGFTNVYERDIDLTPRFTVQVMFGQ